MGDAVCRIKLCGLSRVSDIICANELMPDYIGFVFARGSRRYVAPQTAMELRSRLSSGITPVGVFAGEAPGVIADIIERRAIDVVQLHGDEDADCIEELRRFIGAPIWQAFRIKDADDIAAANASAADMVLLDSGGGSGTPFDWQLLTQVSRPFFLAGGLTPQNVTDAIRKYSPAGVDASSCLETAGVKDAEKMRMFVRAVLNEKLKTEN